MEISCQQLLGWGGWEKPEISLWPDPGNVKRAFLGAGRDRWALDLAPGHAVLGWHHLGHGGDMMNWRFRPALFFGEQPP